MCRNWSTLKISGVSLSAMEGRMYGYQKTDLVELRRRANENLVRVRSGYYRATTARAAERREQEKAARAVGRELKKQEQAERRQLKEELKELTKLCNFYDRKLTKGTISKEEMGAYEEVDHRREQVMEELDPYVWRR
jgi:hypothetical protein